MKKLSFSRRILTPLNQRIVGKLLLSMRFASSIFATFQDIPETIVSYVGQIVFVKAMLYFVFFCQAKYVSLSKVLRFVKRVY